MHLICDIDNTLADARHRAKHLLTRPKKWDAFYAEAHRDPPFLEMIRLLHSLSETYDVYFSTGRPETYRNVTTKWLETHLYPIEDRWLYMRKAGDHRADYLIKLEHLAALRAAYGLEEFIIEDRKAVVGALRKAGARVLQVAEGDY